MAMLRSKLIGETKPTLHCQALKIKRFQHCPEMVIGTGFERPIAATVCVP